MPEGARSQAFLRQYEEKMVGPREEYLASHFPGRKFSDLSPDEQEEVAEYANEFAVEWWLSFDDKRFDEETLSPREMAANVAYKINHLVNLPKFMPDNGSVDLLSVGHKTSTEAFLKFALERVANGDVVTGFENLVEIGGSLKILDSWELVAKTDSQGQLQVSLTIRRENGDTQVCSISREILRQLSLEYIKSHDLNIKKIDCLD
ncbi:MAG: hypothetical protein ACD_72C00347G0002 [uncultured bacterium]|nr:MAG: hypothetical protein ACD_72C00347G0002 [uncultured bacterium]